MFRILTLLSFSFLFTSCYYNQIAPLKVIGTWHKIKDGETVQSIAKEYGVSPNLIVELNDISSTDKINVNEIFIPLSSGSTPGNGEIPPEQADKVVKNESPKTNVKSDEPVKGHCNNKDRPCFSWPLKGKVIKQFGPYEDGHSDGLDISAKEGTAVNAIGDGVVLYSGDAIKGYGNLILIKHKDDIISVYAHNSKLLVKEKEEVKKDQKIAEVGMTGAATTNKLHLEIRIKENPVDPLLYLP
ncbi:MAG: peptidoglycan DD-metalloendopeptidase family protein [Deltaproteobacteria bacterium]|nr:peptidoglycan DD-metalloendopeptidase family protein [Deltaproteobacteria bacterium]